MPNEHLNNISQIQAGCPVQTTHAERVGLVDLDIVFEQKLANMAVTMTRSRDESWLKALEHLFVVRPFVVQIAESIYIGAVLNELLDDGQIA